MFCIHCGKEIQTGSKFCTYCGGAQPVPESAPEAVEAEQAPESTPEAVAAEPAGAESNSEESVRPGETIGNAIDSAAEEIGKGIEDAAEDIKSGAEEIRQVVIPAAGAVGDGAGGGAIPPEGKKDWKEYITPENMELAAVLTLLLPVFSAVIGFVLHTIGGIVGSIDILETIFGILSVIIGLIFVIASGVGLASCIYILANKPEKRNVWSYITLGGAVLAFIACFGMMIPNGIGPVFAILALISFIWGLDAVSRVFLQKKGMESEANIGDDLNSYSQWYKDYKEAHPSSTENEAQRIQNDPEASYFDGSGLTLLGLNILTVLVSTITCGIAAPWMICKLYKWRKEHTVINGRRLRFTGTGGSLLGHWILWEILCVITCGIYSFFMHVALRKWEMEHTEYADQPNVLGSFDGDSFEYFGYGLLQALLLLLTCGLAAPWTITMIQKWEMRHAIVAGDRMTYEGTALGLLGQYIIIFLLTLITCGIYAPWGTVRLNKYIYSHTRVYK